MAQSAVIVRVPEAEDFVSALRALHDPSARRGVPAHITLLYPFKEPAQITATDLLQLGRLAAATACFRYRLTGIERFPGVLYLRPDPSANFVALTEALVALFPAHRPYAGEHAAIVPHLTVAQVEPHLLDGIEGILRTSLPAAGIASVCDELALIENSSGRWMPMRDFALSYREDDVAG